MKKICFSMLLVATTVAGFSQDKEEEEKTPGFKKENLFTGGSVNLSFGNNATSLGVTPHFGYSFNKYLDLAVSLGYNYISQRDINYYGDKARQTVIGPGAFVRIFPVKFLFVQGQYEYNFIKVKYIQGNNIPDEIYKTSAPSFLVGGGYSQGRGDGGTYFYVSVLFDILKNENSPYRDNLNRTMPVFRTGINIPLFQGKKN
ncbi:MAG: hypothetical protein ABIT96_00515 [Ferruginibacter sp.]